MANSKISSVAKKWLKRVKAVKSPSVEFHTNEETTIAFCDKPNCNTIEFSLSVMSPDETKFRRKVGEFWAMDRMINGQTVKMKREDFYAMMENLYSW